MSVALPAPEGASKLRNQTQSGDCYDASTELAEVLSSSLSDDSSSDMILLFRVLCCRFVVELLSFVVASRCSSVKEKKAVISV